MRTSKIIHVVSCHAEGEVGDVIVGGVAPPPGETLWEQSRFIARDGALRDFVLNEPRGGVFRHVNLLVPAKDPRAQMGFIIMEPEDTPPMSGSNSICVATVLLDTGILPMQEPETQLDAGGAGRPDRGRRADCRGGKAERITIENVPSFADRLEAPLEVAGPRNAQRRHRLWRRQLRHRRCAGARLFDRPGRGARPRGDGHDHRRRRQRTARLSPIPKTPAGTISPSASSPGRSPGREGEITGPNAVVVRPGKIDRSPTGTGCSARMAALSARGLMKVGERLSRPLDHRLGIRLPDCARDEGRRAARDRPGHFRPRLDHRGPPACAGPGRPLAVGVPARRHLAAPGALTTTFVLLDDPIPMN